MKKILMIAVALATLTLVTACGTKSDSSPGTPQRDTFSVTLDWYANPDHAGFLVADRKGYFEDAGLDVSLSPPSDPAQPIKLVAAGKADIALTYEPEVLLARQEGLDVVAVASIVDQPLTSMIWMKKSGIKRVRDLKGKVVSTAGIPYQSAYLSTILKRAGLSPDQVREVSVSSALMPSILSGRAKATLGPFWNIEGVQLKMEGRRPVINPVDRLGVPSYSELVLVANGTRLQDDPDPVRLFIAALARGTAAAVAKPNEAIQAVLGANDALKPKVTAAQVRATLPLLQRGGLQGKDQPFGYMDTAKWQSFIEWMVEKDLLEERQMAVDALTNDYLPSAPINTG